MLPDRVLWSVGIFRVVGGEVVGFSLISYIHISSSAGAKRLLGETPPDWLRVSRLLTMAALLLLRQLQLLQ